MKLKIALAISLGLNVAMIVVLLGHCRPRAEWPKQLPDQKPDFAAIEAALKDELALPAHAELFELMSFESRQWLCQARIREKFDEPFGEHYRTLDAIVDSVRTKCKVPGRRAGWVFDPEDHRTLIGSSIEFGYSREVGYVHDNEFIVDYSEERRQDE